MKLFITLLISAILIGCSNYNQISKVDDSTIYSTKNDTIFIKTEPVAYIKHLGWDVDRKNNFTTKIVIQEINFQTESIESVISFVHKKHPSYHIEYRLK
jgi:hypothetical protein